MDRLIRRAEPADCAALAKISAEAFSQPMSEAEFKRELEAAFSITLAAVQGKEVVGFINLWQVCGEADLNNIAVLKAYRRAGLGQALLDAGVLECSGCGSITLEVRESNAAAIAFYRKNGFVPVGRRKGFYEKPAEDAIIYKREL